MPSKKQVDMSSTLTANIFDFVIWYAKNKEIIKYRRLFEKKEPRDQIGIFYDHIELIDGTRRRLLREEIEKLIIQKGAKNFFKEAFFILKGQHLRVLMQ